MSYKLVRVKGISGSLNWKGRVYTLPADLYVTPSELSQLIKLAKSAGYEVVEPVGLQKLRPKFQVGELKTIKKRVVDTKTRKKKESGDETSKDA